MNQPFVTHRPGSSRHWNASGRTSAPYGLRGVGSIDGRQVAVGLVMGFVSGLAMSLTGCAGSGELAARPARAPAGLPGVPGMPVAAGSRAALLGSAESGLEVRQWRVDDKSEVIATALGRHADASWPEPDLARRFQRNGFRVLRVPVAAIETLPDELGGSSLDVEGWHGQMYDWRELAVRPLEDEGRAIAMQGRVLRLGGGRLRLMMRGWTMLMESAPQLYLELVPEHDRSRPSRLDQMLRRRPFIGERFTEQAVELMLDAGWAYVLTCEAPGVEWGAEDPDAAPRAPTGPGALGPDVQAPPALGEVLLRTASTPPQRDLVVFVPRIPGALFPPGASPPGAPGAVAPVRAARAKR